MELSPARRVGLFVAFTFAGSWALLLFFWLGGVPWGGAETRFLAILYGFPPAIAALAIQGAILKEPVAEPLGLRLGINRWYLFASLAPLLVAALTVAVSALLPGVDIAATTEQYIAFVSERVPADMRDQIPEMARQLRDEGMHPALRRALQALIAGLTLNMLVSLGEEIGWRGFLPNQLRGDFFRRALVTGAVWGVWLAPIGVPLYYPDHPVSGTCLLLAWTLLQSPLLLYLRLRTGSVVAPSVLRGTFRALTLVPLEVTRGGSDLTIGLSGGAGIAATAIVLALLWAYDRHLSSEPLMQR